MTDPILKIEGVSKRFTRKPGLVVRGLDRLSGRDSTQTVHAVNDVNLSVPRGEVLGIVGESGCGKSTLGRVVSGIYAPSEGTVTLEGQPVARDHRPFREPQPPHEGGRNNRRRPAHPRADPGA